VPNPVNAERWFNKFCKVYARHDHSIEDWRVESHCNGVLVTLVLDRGDVTLLVHRKGTNSFYAEIPSLAISIFSDEDDCVPKLPGNAELVIRQFLNVLRKADKGNLVIPAPSTAGGQGRPIAMVKPDSPQALATRSVLADKLHWGSFLAWKALVTEDLYPHVGPLGELVSDEEIREGWVNTVARMHAGTAPQKLGLYVHVPFCTVACSFCFCRKTDRFNRAGFDTYLDQLNAETENWAEIFKSVSFTSMYFGGGTPSLLSPPAMSRLFSTLFENFDVPKGTQIIYEGNPDSLSARKIEVLATEGHVTRLTIGVQTLDDKVQELVRRFNRPDQVRDAISAARAYGIEHVNCDLMAGLPEQTMSSFQKDLEYLVSLEPDSVHVNGFRPLPVTRLAKDGSVMEPETVILRDEMLKWAQQYLSENGHTSNEMGQSPRRTRNAANIQEYDLRRQNSSLLGLGFPARAHSFAGHYYSPDADQGFDPSLSRELSGKRVWRAVRSSDREEIHKYLVSNLRTGFTPTEFRSLFNCDPQDIAREPLNQLVDLGVLHVGKDELYCDSGDHSQNLIYRTFLMSPEHLARAREVWGAEYDRDLDYKARIRVLCESCG
jgi:coproporphyrinogen III oxidase-like Fe-S oxidoreductase